jgi:hypothetical protein
MLTTDGTDNTDVRFRQPLNQEVYESVAQPSRLWSISEND